MVMPSLYSVLGPALNRSPGTVLPGYSNVWEYGGVMIDIQMGGVKILAWLREPIAGRMNMSRHVHGLAN